MIKYQDSRMILERSAIEGNGPVGEIEVSRVVVSRVRRDTRNPAGNWVDHYPRLNIRKRPIVHQYREGKVKRTPLRGVK